jgi:hypothetical protein
MKTLVPWIVAGSLAGVSAGSLVHRQHGTDPLAMSQQIAHTDDSPAMCIQHHGVVSWTEIDGQAIFLGCLHGSTP